MLKDISVSQSEGFREEKLPSCRSLLYPKTWVKNYCDNWLVAFEIALKIFNMNLLKRSISSASSTNTMISNSESIVNREEITIEDFKNSIENWQIPKYT